MYDEDADAYSVFVEGKVNLFEKVVELTEDDKNRLIASLELMHGKGDILDFYVDRYVPEIYTVGFEDTLEAIEDTCIYTF